MSNLGATRPARLPDLKQMSVNPRGSRYERGTTGGQVREVLLGVARQYGGVQILRAAEALIRYGIRSSE